MKSAYEFNFEMLKKTKPLMSYNGENFAVWQKEAREKLTELLGIDTFQKTEPETEIEYEKKIEGATEIRFTFETEDGYRAPCHILLPDGTEKPPVIICLQGHSTGMHISLGRVIYEGDAKSVADGDRDFCIRAVKEGFAAIAMEQRNFGECGVHPGWADCGHSKLVAELIGRTTIGERVWDIMRLIDLLKTEFSDKVDTDRICLMGNSGGGTATAYTAALDDRITLAMSSCGLGTYSGSIGAISHCSCNYVPHIAKYFEMSDLISMAYPKLFIQVSGITDNYFPIDAAKEVFEKGSATYKEMGSEEKCVLVVGDAGHRFYADLAWPVVHKLLGE